MLAYVDYDTVPAVYHGPKYILAVEILDILSAEHSSRVGIITPAYDHWTPSGRTEAGWPYYLIA